jgi:hypothetical protein
MIGLALVTLLALMGLSAWLAVIAADFLTDALGHSKAVGSERHYVAPAQGAVEHS